MEDTELFSNFERKCIALTPILLLCFGTAFGAYKWGTWGAVLGLLAAGIISILPIWYVIKD